MKSTTSEKHLAEGYASVQARVAMLPTPRPRLLSVATATPSNCYAQDELASLLQIPEGPGRRFFRNVGVEQRYLYLQPGHDGAAPQEDQAALLTRHRKGSLELGARAIARCLELSGVTPHDVAALFCISSTGLMLPGISAMYLRHLGFRPDCHRVDIVGMGCNAALNGLATAAAWSVAHPGRLALMVCCEINSAIYVKDGRIVTALVNSLFGDGCAAILLGAGASNNGPEVFGSASHLVPEAWKAISYHWSQEHGKYELFLDKDIPNVLGEHSPTPITALLGAASLKRSDISHWLVHAGGKKVISAIRDANGLTDHDVRHATNVLKRFGNLSSATVLFSYAELLEENMLSAGDYIVMVTMGPGATIETTLLRW